MQKSEEKGVIPVVIMQIMHVIASHEHHTGKTGYHEGKKSVKSNINY
jgi:hypothetical protein